MIIVRSNCRTDRSNCRNNCQSEESIEGSVRQKRGDVEEQRLVAWELVWEGGRRRRGVGVDHDGVVVKELW